MRGVDHIPIHSWSKIAAVAPRCRGSVSVEDQVHDRGTLLDLGWVTIPRSCTGWAGEACVWGQPQTLSRIHAPLDTPPSMIKCMNKC